MNSTCGMSRRPSMPSISADSAGIATLIGGITVWHSDRSATKRGSRSRKPTRVLPFFSTRRTEEAFEHEDALGMVAKRTMAKVGGDRLGLVDPLVEREVVLRDHAPFTNRREGVMIAMSHSRLPTHRERTRDE